MNLVPHHALSPGLMFWNHASFHLNVHKNPHDKSETIVLPCIYASSLINMITALEMWNNDIDALLNTGSTILCLCTVYAAV